jgi:hypothetical protein
MFRRVLASFLVFVMAAGAIPVHAAGVSALGVVTQASRANLAGSNVSVGSALYDGDSLTTASDGLLRIRAGAAQLYLPGESGVNLHSVSGGTLAQLTGGKLVFSSAKAAAMDIEIAQAHVRPAADRPTVAQISVVGPKMIDIRAQRGALQFSYNGETQLIPEGSAYRFVLDPPEEETLSAATPAFPGQLGPHRKATRRNKAFLYFIIGATAVLTYIAVDEALESPSEP